MSVHRPPMTLIVLLSATLALTGCDVASREGAAPPSAGPSAAPRSAGPSARPPDGSVSSADATDAATSESYQEGWRAVLLAMRSGDVSRVEARTTDAGHASLMQGVGEDDPAATFQRWGKIWAEWEIRWQESTDSTARAQLGPEVKEHGIWLVKDGGTWKLDRWAPGE